MNGARAAVVDGLIWGGVLALVLGGVPAFAVAGSTFSWGPPGGGLAQYLVLLVTLAALMAFGIGVALFVSGDHPRAGVTLMVASALIAASGPLLLSAAFRVRRAGLERFTARDPDPVVAAIERFVEDQARPPDSLDQLVPRYLPELPEPGLASASRGYEYHTRGNARRELGDHEWMLTILLPNRFMSPDLLIYVPDHDYPPLRTDYGDERIGNWFLVRE